MIVGVKCENVIISDNTVMGGILSNCISENDRTEKCNNTHATVLFQFNLTSYSQSSEISDIIMVIIIIILFLHCNVTSKFCNERIDK